MNEHTIFDVVIIGAGFGGICAAIRLQKAGYRSFIILEKEKEVGGTWRDNIYPGCACDVPSNLYSYSFNLNPNWSRSFSKQPEILEYLKDTVNKFDLDKSIKYDSKVEKAVFDSSSGQWIVTTTNGLSYTSRFVISATGPLNVPAYPSIKGLDTFQKPMHHTNLWPKDINLKGKKVAVIGTGASAVQTIPNISNEVSEMMVYQRSAPWIFPKQDSTISNLRKFLKSLPLVSWLAYQFTYWLFESRVSGILYDGFMSRQATRTALKHIDAQIQDPELRKKVTPDYKIGCKRVLLSDDYFPALQEPHVHLNTTAIDYMDSTSIVDVDGNSFDPDVVILATGFQASERMINFDFIGLDNKSLIAEWERNSPQAYYGINVTDFPNLLILVGPNTGLGHNSIIFMMEAQMNYVLDYIKKVNESGSKYFNLKTYVQKEFNKTIQDKMKKTTWLSGCKSWYQTSEGLVTTLWPDSTVSYKRETSKINISNFELG